MTLTDTDRAGSRSRSRARARTRTTTSTSTRTGLRARARAAGRGKYVAALALVAAAAAPVLAPAASSWAADGPIVRSAPADMFRLAGCTGWAASPSVGITAKHCTVQVGELVVTARGGRHRVTRVVGYPGGDVMAFTTDSTSLVPFTFGSLRVGQTAQVYGFGRTRTDGSFGTLRRTTLGRVNAPDGEGFIIDVSDSTGTVCHGDSGAPILQRGRVVGQVYGGNGVDCGTFAVYGQTLTNATAWFRSVGVL